MVATRIAMFDFFQAKYGGATVHVRKAGQLVLASIFRDEAKTIPAANPVTLLSNVVDGVDYGKWPYPLYIDEPYELYISSTDRSGIARPPLVTLEGADASKAVVTPGTGTEAAALDEILGRTVFAVDYGEINSSDTAENTSAIQIAIGVAAGAGGGEVILPPIPIPVSQITVPGSVILRGYGRGVTTLQSQTNDHVMTITGDRAGLRGLTLDGINSVDGGVGFYAVGKNEIVLDQVDIKRFDTGMHLRGGKRSAWKDLSLINNNVGALLHGDKNAADGNNGGPFSDNTWTGGYVAQNITTGLEIAYEDTTCSRFDASGIVFEDNTGAAFRVDGATVTRLRGCSWTGNTINLDVKDGTDVDVDNVVIGLHIVSGIISGGECKFTGECQDVIIQDARFTGAGTLTMTVPVLHPVLLLDCTESATMAISGDGTRIIRRRSTNEGSSSGITADATVTKAWSMTLEPGQIVYADAVVIGKGRNVASTAEYHLEVSAKMAGAALGFDTQTADFTLGDVITGQTSKATGRLVAQTDSGTSGTLTLTDLTGTFIDNEQLKDTHTGVALANGTAVNPAVTLLGAVLVARSREDIAGWGATLVANGPELELRVTGAASTVIEWTAHVTVRSS